MKKDIFICMDDSGKLNANEKICIYSGIVFLDQKNRDVFMNSYKKIVDRIKCKYCKNSKDSCNNSCPEIKSNIGLQRSHRRQLMKLIENQYTYAVIIKNEKVNPKIMADKASRGRYSDYVQKRIIKQIIKNLINMHVIDDHDDLFLHLFLDEQPTVTNGYYDLASSIKEELVYGIFNFNYQKSFDPILFGKFEITLKYRDSKLYYDVQAADIIAGTIRRSLINNEEPREDPLKTIARLADVYLILP